MSLYPFQLEGVDKIVDLFRTQDGVLLADEMGLGKTVQAIHVINRIVKPRTTANVLVVCPKSLINNWHEELDTHLWRKDDLRVEIVTYGRLKTAKLPEDIDLLILDEAHYAKNVDSKRSIATRELAKKAKKTLLLTGTPILNCPAELFPLLSIMNPKEWDPAGFKGPQGNRYLMPPGELGGWEAFAKRYCNPRRVRVGKRFVWDFRGSSNEVELNDRLRGSGMVRRLKRDVLTELPPKTRQIVMFERSKIGISEALHDALQSEGDWDDIYKRVRAQKILFEEWSTTRHAQGLEKVPYVVEHVSELLESVPKVVIFAHHTDVILELAKGLIGHGLAIHVGDTPATERSEAVDRFQEDPDCHVFLASIGTAGVGLTLTAASLVCFAEASPVPGEMTQCEDRVHRITQRYNVLVKHLVMQDSIDGKIIKILLQKQRVIDMLLSGVGET